jgi:hypothetical protein
LAGDTPAGTFFKSKSEPLYNLTGKENGALVASLFYRFERLSESERNKLNLILIVFVLDTASLSLSVNKTSLQRSRIPSRHRRLHSDIILEILPTRRTTVLVNTYHS